MKSFRKKNNYDNNIKWNFFENFLFNILIYIESDNAKFKNIFTLDKIKLVQD